MAGHSGVLIDTISVILFAFAVVLMIVLISRFFRMSNDIKVIREFMTPEYAFFDGIQRLINEGKIDQARESLKKIVDKHPQWAPVHRKVQEMLNQINNQ